MNKIKLNLGCGHDLRENYINVDIDPTCNPDLVADLTQKLPFQDKSIDKVVAQDILEHFTKQDADLFVEELSRICNLGAKVSIRIPNVLQIVDQFSQDHEVMTEFLYGTTENGIWGVHKNGYNKQSLKKLFNRHGFKLTSFTTETTNYVAQFIKVEKPQLPKILVVMQAPDWGGAEEWMLNLITAFSKNNQSVRLITNLEKLKKKVGSSANTQHLPMVLDIIGNFKGLVKSTMLLPFALTYYANILVKAKYQGYRVVVMSNLTEKLLVTWLAILLNLDIVWFEYGPLKEVFSKNIRFPKLVYRATKHLPGRVITISNHTKDSLIKDARISLSKIKLIPPGTNIPKVQSKKPKSNITIGSLSRICPEKGQEVLIQAWKYVVRGLPRAKLLIAGDGPQKKDLEKLVKKLGIENSVEFLGFVGSKADFFNQLDIFVFSSIWSLEGFGIASIEAMAHGVPTIAFDKPPTNEIIKHKANGILVTSQTPESLAKAIIKLANDKTLQKTLSKNSQNTVKQHYSLADQTQKTISEINQVYFENYQYE